MGSRSPQTACTRLHLEVCQGISEGSEAWESPWPLDPEETLLEPETESAAASQEPDEKNHHPEM